METTESSSARSATTEELVEGDLSSGGTSPSQQQEAQPPSESSSSEIIQGDSSTSPSLQIEAQPPSETTSEQTPSSSEIIQGASPTSPSLQIEAQPPSETTSEQTPSSSEIIQGASSTSPSLQIEAQPPSETTSEQTPSSSEIIQGDSSTSPSQQQEAQPPSESSSSEIIQGASSTSPSLQIEAQPPSETTSEQFPPPPELIQRNSPPSPRLQHEAQPPSETSSQLSPSSPELVQGGCPPSPRLQRDTGSCSPRLQRGSAPPSPRLPRGVVPPVPPETYRWEDVRRQRALGGYPWSHLDKPPLGSKEDLNDHEYEVINPPPPRVDVDPPSDEKKEADDVGATPRKRIDSETSSLGSGDPNFVRIPLHGDADDNTSKDVSAQELQERMEERFFAATPETTASRTDCDVNTSQLDSSGLEDLPLQRGSRKKKDDRESEARGLQQRIRSQAGRIRAKLRSMKMPERPKFNLPDRPKFNMPERPKFNLPERPKFNLPERPKFKFPERPKFNMPQRPKISMPSMPSFSTSSKERPAKKTSSTRRPLRDRVNPSTESNASSTRKNFFDFDFKTYPRIFDRSRRKGDYATSSPKSSPRSQTPPPSMESTKPTITSRKKGPVGSRWVHRFTDIKYVDDEDQRQAEDADEARYGRDRDSPDFRIIKLRDSTEEEKDDEELRRDKIRYENEVRDAVEELNRQRQERESVHTESTTAFRDKDYDYAVGLTLAETNAQRNESIPESNREEQSSGSSSDRHRAGVLEEIDSDEFFLRQKGISQEDVEVGRYLTSEIREAFRPPTNTLSQMDEKYFYDEEEQEEDADNLGNQYRGTPEREPVPPARTRSLKPRKRGNRAPPAVEEEDGSSNFNTFPPARPKRNRRQQEEEEAQGSREDEDALEDEREEVSRPPVPYIPTESQDMSYDEQPEEENVGRMDDDWQEEEEIKPKYEVTPPLAPRRVRRSRQEQKANSREYVPEGQRNGHYTHDDWKENMEPNIMAQEVVALRMEPDYIIPGEPESTPVAPKRERRRTTSRGASTHSLAEGRTSRGADSLRMDDDQKDHVIAGEEREQQDIQTEQYRDESMPDDSCRTDREQQEREHQETQQRSQDVDLGESGGYAIVEKIYPVKPPRPNRPKPPRPPAPTRRKRLGHFFSLPRRNNHAPPTRPLRNYSTLGPSRPSRRDRARKSESYVEIEGDLSPLSNEESHREDLQSGDVIERMKGRPLPAPPRPPRKTREAHEEEGDPEVIQVEATIPQPDNSEHALGALNDAVFYSTKEIIVPVAKEISSVTQSTKPAETVSQEEIKTSSEEPAPSSKPEETSPVTSQVAETSVIADREAFLEQDNLAVETSEPFEEVTVATQTDPLPDDFCMEVEDEEPPEHADACTETIEIELEVPLPAASAESSKKIDTSPAEKTVVSEEPVNVRLQEVVQQAPEPVRRPATPPPPPPPTIIEREVPVYILPDKDTVIELRAERLQVSDLDVERLNVGELHSQKIFVSDIDGVSMQVAELSSKSGKLVINGIELPPGFLQELYDSFPRPEPLPQPTPSLPQSEPVAQISLPPTEPISQPPSTPSECVSQPITSVPPSFYESQTISSPPQPPVTSLPSEPVPPSIPPPPLHIPMDPAYSYIPSAMRVRRSQIPDMESEEEIISFVPSSHRRRRHHVPKPVPRYSTDEEDESVSFQPRRHPQRSDPSIVELGRQLGQAVTTTSMRAVRSLIQYTTTQLEGEDKRRELQTVLCILLILVAGLILMGFGTGKTFHHHHWDYLSPPQ